MTPHILVRIVLEAALEFKICLGTRESSASQASHSRSVTGVPLPFLFFDGCLQRLLVAFLRELLLSWSTLPPSHSPAWSTLQVPVLRVSLTTVWWVETVGCCVCSCLHSAGVMFGQSFNQPCLQGASSEPAATRESSYVTGFLAGGRRSDYRLYQRRLGFGCCHYKTGSRFCFRRRPGQEICYCEIMRPAVCLF